MDPHSRFSHFDKRNPRAGPQSLSQKPRFMESIKTNLDGFSSAKQQDKKGTGSRDSTPIRPFVTNSRVKQDEKTRKDMYLAFVNNALQEKANVSTRTRRLLSVPNPASRERMNLSKSSLASLIRNVHQLSCLFRNPHSCVCGSWHYLMSSLD